MTTNKSLVRKDFRRPSPRPRPRDAAKRASAPSPPPSTATKESLVHKVSLAPYPDATEKTLKSARAMQITIPPAPPVGSKRCAQNAKTQTDAGARPSVTYSYIHIHPSSTSYSIIFTSVTPRIASRRALGAIRAFARASGRPDATCPSTPNVRTVQIFVPPCAHHRHIATPAPTPSARGIINATAHQRVIASFISAPLAPPREVACNENDAIPICRFAHPRRR